VFFVVCSTKTAIPVFSPATVPTNVSGGRSGSVGSGGIAMAGRTGRSGGRREGEKIGRSRVIDNLERGTAQTALPIDVFSAGDALTGCGWARLMPVPTEFILLPNESAAVGKTEIKIAAATKNAVPGSIRLAKRTIILHLATALKLKSKCAFFL
jgi:hypothetical protein